MRISMLLLVFSLAAGLPVDPASAFTVSLPGSPARLGTESNDGVSSSDSDTELVDALPNFQFVSSGSGGAFSFSRFELTDAGFYVPFQHSRTSANGSVGVTTLDIDFVVDQNVDYYALGFYRARDPDGRRVFLEASLEDASGYLFNSVQESHSTPNEIFVLGVTAPPAKPGASM